MCQSLCPCLSVTAASSRALREGERREEGGRGREERGERREGEGERREGGVIAV